MKFYIEVKCDDSWEPWEEREMKPEDVSKYIRALERERGGVYRARIQFLGRWLEWRLL